MNANDILKLLEKRHLDDFFLKEVKNGPSIDGYLRLDAWAMKKSWSHPKSIGYEIKVSRQDFLNDNKWHGYLNYCNEFYFVCLDGTIDKSELPTEVGLITISSNGSKLFTKKKAVYRNIVIPENFYKYILMCRVYPLSTWNNYLLDDNTKEGKIRYWKKWIETKEEDRQLGHLISKQLKQKYENDVNKVIKENSKLKEKIKEYDDIKNFLVQEGFDLNQKYGLYYEIKGVVDRFKKIIPPGFTLSLNHLKKEIEIIEKILQLK